MENNRFLKLAALAAAVVFVFMGNVTEAYAQTVFDSVSEGYVEVSASNYVDCIDCAGDGICTLCNGNGKATTMLGSWGCTICHRSGKCSTCGGSGVLTEVEYVVERNIDNTPTATIQTGSPNDLYACRYCFGTGICKFCSGDGINDTTGNKCVFCSNSKGVCNTCSGYGCLTRDEHNQKIAENTARRSAKNSSGSEGGETCTSCNGSGKGSVCHTCGGDGKYRGSSMVLGAFIKNKCIDCDGSGYERCSLCKGSGIIY